MHFLFSITQAGHGRIFKQEHEEISLNHVQTFISGSAHVCRRRELCADITFIFISCPIQCGKIIALRLNCTGAWLPWLQAAINTGDKIQACGGHTTWLNDEGEKGPTSISRAQVIEAKPVA